MSRRKARGWLLVLILVGGPPLVTWLATHPDALVRTKMRAALAVKHAADGQAGFWSEIAARAATAYNKARP